ncbi:hypothetical protein V8D89_009618 [Ganoderma adspersum]
MLSTSPTTPTSLSPLLLLDDLRCTLRQTRDPAWPGAAPGPSYELPNPVTTGPDQQASARTNDPRFRYAELRLSGVAELRTDLLGRQHHKIGQRDAICGGGDVNTVLHTRKPARTRADIAKSPRNDMSRAPRTFPQPACKQIRRAAMLWPQNEAAVSPCRMAPGNISETFDGQRDVDRHQFQAAPAVAPPRHGCLEGMSLSPTRARTSLEHPAGRLSKPETTSDGASSITSATDPAGFAAIGAG